MPKTNFLLLLIFLILSNLSSQAHSTQTQEKENQKPDTLKMNNVRVFEDERINLIVHKPTIKNKSGKTKGFRVQIYNGTDRERANEIRVEFMKQNPSVPAYLIYNKPNFRVRVGNFTNRASANELARKLNNQYSCMVVPEIVFVHY